MRVALLTQDPVLRDFLEELLRELSLVTLTRELDDKTQVVIQEECDALGLRDQKSPALPTITITKTMSVDPFTLVMPFKARALLRLVEALESHRQHPWVVGALVFSPAQKSIALGEKVIYLTQLEAELFEALCESAAACSIQMLQEQVLGYAPEAETHAVETHLYRLRKKLSLIGLEGLILSQEQGYSLSQGAHRQSKDPDLPYLD